MLVNLVNALDPSKYDITLQTLFDHGVNRKFLKPHVRYKSFFPCAPFHGITRLQRLFSPRFLYRRIIRERYDIAIAYLENSTTRIIAGCPFPDTRTFAWVHNELIGTGTYRHLGELKECYESFRRVAFVSEKSAESFRKAFPGVNIDGRIVGNTLDIENIKHLSGEPLDLKESEGAMKMCAVGNLTHRKGIERLVRVLGHVKALGVDNWHLYLLGDGEDRPKIEKLIGTLGLESHITLLGYRENPYKYVARMDFVVCPSYHEGYSTAVSEAIVLGVPVLTTDCSGMREILGDGGAGLIVANDDEAFKDGLLKILSNPEMPATMRATAAKRSEIFSTATSTTRFERFIGE